MSIKFVVVFKNFML